MWPTDQQAHVRAAIRQALPEYAERNGVELTERQMDNLAHWAANSVPPNVYRQECPANAAGIPCACPGTCHAWWLVPSVPIRQD